MMNAFQRQVASQLAKLRGREGLTVTKVSAKADLLMRLPVVDQMVGPNETGRDRALAVCALVHDFLHHGSKDDDQFRALAHAYNVDVENSWSGELVRLSSLRTAEARRVAFAKLIYAAYNNGQPMLKWEKEVIKRLAVELASLKHPPAGLSLSGAAVPTQASDAWNSLSKSFSEREGTAPCDFQVQRLISDYRLLEGRTQHLQAMHHFLRTDVDVLLVCEPSGTGKTALLARWVEELQTQDGDWRALYVPISQRYGTAGSKGWLARLAYLLAKANDEVLTSAELSLDTIHTLVANQLSSPRVDPIVIVIDGLDEAQFPPDFRALFPPIWPAGIKLVASARDSANSNRQDWLRRLGIETAATIPQLTPLTKNEVAALLTEAQASEKEDAALAGEIHRVSNGEPLTARVIIDDLVDGRITSDRLNTRLVGLDEYFQVDLDLIASSQHGELSQAVYELLGYCALAKGPLTSQQLAELSPETLGRRESQNVAVRAVERYLVGDGSDLAGFDFGHPRFRESYLQRSLMEGEALRFRSRLIESGFEQLEKDPGEVVSNYVRSSLVAHLLDANELDRCVDLLTLVDTDRDGTRPVWASTHYAADRSYAHYLADATATLQALGPTAPIEMTLRLCLMVGSVHSLSSNLPPALPALMCTVSDPKTRWSTTTALDRIEAIHDHQVRASALIVATEIGQFEPSELLHAAGRIANPETRATILVSIAKQLPEDVLQAAHPLNSTAKSTVLVALAPHLPDEVLDASSTLDASEKKAVLVALAPHLPDEVLDASSTLDASEKKAVLVALAPHLPEEVLAQTGKYDTEVLVALSPLLPQAALMRSARINDEVLVALAPHLPEDVLMYRPKWHISSLAAVAPHIELHRVRKAAKQIKERFALRDRNGEISLDGARAALDIRESAELVQLSSYLSQPDQAMAKTAALLAWTGRIGSIERAQQRDPARYATGPLISDSIKWMNLEDKMFFAAMLPLCLELLPSDDARSDMLCEVATTTPKLALDSALTLSDAAKARVLVAIAPALPVEALALGKQLSGALSQLVTAAVAPYLPEPDGADLLDHALEKAESIEDQEIRSAVLTALAPVFPDEILDLELRKSDNFDPAILAALAPHHPDRLLDLFIDSRLSQSELSQAELLRGLAPHRPDSVAVLVRLLEHSILREQVYLSLAPYAPEVVFDVAMEDHGSFSRTPLLVALAPHLPERVLDAAVKYEPSVLLAAVPHLESTVAAELLRKAINWWTTFNVPKRLALQVALKAVSDESVSELDAGYEMDHLFLQNIEEQTAIIGALATLVGSEIESKELHRFIRSRDQDSAAAILTVLAPHVPHYVAREAMRLAPHNLREVLSAAAATPDAVIPLLARLERSDLGHVLIALSESAPTEALAASAKLNEKDRTNFLVAAACRIPVEVVAEARDLQDEPNRSVVLAATATHLDEPLRSEVIQEALAAVITPTVHQLAIRSVLSLSPGLPIPARFKAIKETLARADALSIRPRSRQLLQLASEIDDASLHRTLVLRAFEEAKEEFPLYDLFADLALVLPEPHRREAFELAVDACGPSRDGPLSDFDHQWRDRDLVTILSRLSPMFPTQALAIGRAMRTQKSRIEVIVDAVAHLPQSAFTRSGQLKRQRRFRYRRPGAQPYRDSAFDAILDLEVRLATALRMSDPERTESLTELASDCSRVFDTATRCRMLATIASQLPEPARKNALHLISEDLADWKGHPELELLRELAPEIPNAVLRIARSLDDDDMTKQLLYVSLAPHLPDEILSDSRSNQEQLSVDSLKALAPHRPQEVVSESSQLAHAFERADVLRAVVPFLTGTDLTSTFNAVSCDESLRSVFGAIGPFLDEPQQTKCIREAISDAAKRHSLPQAAVTALTQRAPGKLLAQLPRLDKDLLREDLLHRLSQHLDADSPDFQNDFFEAITASAQKSKDRVLELIAHLTKQILHHMSPTEVARLSAQIQGIHTLRWPT